MEIDDCTRMGLWLHRRSSTQRPVSGLYGCIRTGSLRPPSRSWRLADMWASCWASIRPVCVTGSRTATVVAGRQRARCYLRAATRTLSLQRCAMKTLNCAGPMRSQDSVGVFRRGGGRPPTSLIVDYIDAYRHRFGVDPICAVLSEHGIKIAPSTYYAAKARGPVSDAMWAEAHAAHAVDRCLGQSGPAWGPQDVACDETRWSRRVPGSPDGPRRLRPARCSTGETPLRR